MRTLGINLTSACAVVSGRVCVVPTSSTTCLPYVLVSFWSRILLGFLLFLIKPVYCSTFEVVKFSVGWYSQVADIFVHSWCPIFFIEVGFLSLERCSRCSWMKWIIISVGVIDVVTFVTFTVCFLCLHICVVTNIFTGLVRKEDIMYIRFFLWQVMT